MPSSSYLSLLKHTRKQKQHFDKLLGSPFACLTPQFAFLHSHHLYCAWKPNKPKLKLTVVLPRRVRPKWNVLDSAVMNVQLPREAASMRARCVTMETCGTARAVSSVPATEVRSSARGLSVVVLSARRWAWEKKALHYKPKSKSGLILSFVFVVHFLRRVRSSWKRLTGLFSWARDLKSSVLLKL